MVSGRSFLSYAPSQELGRAKGYGVKSLREIAEHHKRDLFPFHGIANIVSNSQQGCNGGMPFTESRDAIVKKMGVVRIIRHLNSHKLLENLG